MSEERINKGKKAGREGDTAPPGHTALDRLFIHIGAQDLLRGRQVGRKEWVQGRSITQSGTALGSWPGDLSTVQGKRKRVTDTSCHMGQEGEIQGAACLYRKR